MSANAHTAEEGWVGWKPLVERLEDLLVRSGGAELVPLLALRSWMFWGSPQQPSLVGMDVEFFLSQKLQASPFLG